MWPALDDTPRRGFLTRMAAGAAALAVGGWSAASAEAPTILVSGPVGDEWLSRIKGQVHAGHKLIIAKKSASHGSRWALVVAGGTGVSGG